MDSMFKVITGNKDEHKEMNTSVTQHLLLESDHCIAIKSVNNSHFFFLMPLRSPFEEKKKKKKLG